MRDAAGSSCGAAGSSCGAEASVCTGSFDDEHAATSIASKNDQRSANPPSMRGRGYDAPEPAS